MTRQVWIGMAQVEPRKGNNVLEGAVGAFVNALAIADDETEWQARTRDALREIGFDLKAFEDAEPFWAREHSANPSEELRRYAEEARLSGEVRFGCFQAFDTSG